MTVGETFEKHTGTSASKAATGTYYTPGGTYVVESGGRVTRVSSIGRTDAPVVHTSEVRREVSTEEVRAAWEAGTEVQKQIPKTEKAAYEKIIEMKKTPEGIVLTANPKPTADEKVITQVSDKQQTVKTPEGEFVVSKEEAKLFREGEATVVSSGVAQKLGYISKSQARGGGFYIITEHMVKQVEVAEKVYGEKYKELSAKYGEPRETVSKMDVYKAIERDVVKEQVETQREIDKAMSDPLIAFSYAVRSPTENVGKLIGKIWEGSTVPEASYEIIKERMVTESPVESGIGAAVGTAELPAYYLGGYAYTTGMTALTTKAPGIAKVVKVVAPFVALGLTGREAYGVIKDPSAEKVATFGVRLGTMLTLGYMGSRAAKQDLIAKSPKELLGIREQEVRTKGTIRKSEGYITKAGDKEKFTTMRPTKEVMDVVKKGKVTYEDPNWMIKRLGDTEVFLSKQKTGYPTVQPGELIDVMRTQVKYGGRFSGMDVYIRKATDVPITFESGEAEKFTVGYKPGGEPKRDIISDLSKSYLQSQAENIAKSMAKQRAIVGTVSLTSAELLGTPSKTAVIGGVVTASKALTTFKPESVQRRVGMKTTYKEDDRLFSDQIAAMRLREKQDQKSKQDQRTRERSRKKAMETVLKERGRMTGLVTAPVPVQREKQKTVPLQQLVQAQMLTPATMQRTVGLASPRVPTQPPTSKVRLPSFKFSAMKGKGKKGSRWKYFERKWPVAVSPKEVARAFKALTRRKRK